jgi:hypothetical protein
VVHFIWPFIGHSYSSVLIKPTLWIIYDANSDISMTVAGNTQEVWRFTFAAFQSMFRGIALDIDGNNISFYRNGSIVNSAVP